MIRMIASDLDGTLLRKDWSISEYTIKIIKEAQASGIRWVTVTGRSDRGARPIMENYGLSCDYILMNGAEFRDTNGNLIKSENIDTDLARFVCEKLHRENLGFEINTDRGDYTTTMELAEYSDYLEDGYEKLFEEKHNIRKILVFCDDIHKIRRIKQQIYDASGLSVLSSFENNMEVTSQKAKKGIMLKQAMKHFGFLPEEVVVFGDGENDISMFQEFPCTKPKIYGYDALKELAYRVTEYSNDEDGVAKTLEKILKA